MTNFIKPKLRPLGVYTGHLFCQTGGLGVNVIISELDNGIVSMIEQFGSNLYYGFPHKHIFLNYFYQHKRYSLIQELNKFDPDDKTMLSGDVDKIALYLYMARIAQSQKWKYPSLLTRRPDGEIEQTTGGTRAFAVGLTKPEPWKHFPVLMLEDVNKDINQVLADPVHIANDQQLTEILGGVYDKEVWDPTVKLLLGIKKTTSGHSYCLLQNVDDYTHYDLSADRGQEYLKKFIKWKQQNPTRPKLKIYTNYPQSIRDINGIWDWEIVGNNGNIESLMGNKVAWIENMARNYHVDQKTHGGDYVLWLLKERTIDLGDLLPWMDNQFTTYISNDWSFALYRPDDVFVSTFIDVSYQE